MANDTTPPAAADRTIALTKAVATSYGEPADVVEIIQTEVPGPGPGQVLVELRAAGINPIDAKIVHGAMGADASALPRDLGFEAAGVISALGDGVDDLAVGDEVIVYRATAGFADRVVADIAAVHPKPADLDFEHAAGLLLVGVTAADTVATAGIGPDDVVLIHGGSGAVGSIAVQLAVRAGATVLATGSAANQDFIASLGATPVIYGPGLADRVRAAAPGPVTAAIDTVGTDEAIDTSLELVADRDRVVSIAAWGRADDGIVLINGSSPDSKRHRSEAIPGLIADATAGTLVTEIAKTFPLSETGRALSEQLSSHPRGKFILLT
ncbi:NADP-dependent oxidoreductase [Gordonia sinesedis]